MQIWLHKTQIAYLEHPQPLRKSKKIVLDALNGIFVIWRGQCAYLHLGGAVTHVRRGLTQYGIFGENSQNAALEQTLEKLTYDVITFDALDFWHHAFGFEFI